MKAAKWRSFVRSSRSLGSKAEYNFGRAPRARSQTPNRDGRTRCRSRSQIQPRAANRLAIRAAASGKAGRIPDALSERAVGRACRGTRPGSRPVGRAGAGAATPHPWREDVANQLLNAAKIGRSLGVAGMREVEINGEPGAVFEDRDGGGSVW
jgi:hypothetical protein